MDAGLGGFQVGQGLLGELVFMRGAIPRFEISRARLRPAAAIPQVMKYYAARLRRDSGNCGCSRAQLSDDASAHPHNREIVSWNLGPILPGGPLEPPQAQILGRLQGIDTLRALKREASASKLSGRAKDLQDKTNRRVHRIMADDGGEVRLRMLRETSSPFSSGWSDFRGWDRRRGGATEPTLCVRHDEDRSTLQLTSATEEPAAAIRAGTARKPGHSRWWCVDEGKELRAMQGRGG